jgi:hypothetical protein
MLYHDLEGVGYGRIASETKLWRPLSSKTIRHNTKVLRESLSKWSKQQIVLNDYHLWNKVSKSLSLEESGERVNLWIDSTDFKKQQPEKHSVKSD